MSKVIMIKLSLKQKIIQGAFMGVTYAFIMFLFDLGMGEKFSLLRYVIHVIFFGGIMGILLPYVTDRQIKKTLDKITIEVSEDEQVQLEDGATLKTKRISDGGKLILTDKRLAFSPRKSVLIEIPLSEITEVEKKKTLGFVNNTFVVKTNSEDYNFFVSENVRDVWVSSINNLLN